MVVREHDEAQQLLDRAAEAVVIVDARQPHLPILAANAASRATLPAHRPAPLGQPWSAVFPEFAAQGLGTIVRRTIATGEPCAIAGFTLPPSDDAPPIHCDWQCRPLTEHDGAVRRVAIITVGARRGGAQRQGPEHPVAAQPPLGFALVTGPDHTVAFANVALAALLGHGAGALAGQQFFALAPALARTPLAGALQLVSATGQPQTLDRLTVPMRMGEQRHWSLRLLPTPSGDEHPGGILLVVRDGTAQAGSAPPMAHAAHPHTRQLAALLAAIDDGAFVLDRAGRIESANETGRTLLALPDVVAGLSLGDFLAPPRVRLEDGRPGDVARELLDPLGHGATRTESVILVATGTAERVIALGGTPIRDDAGASVGAILLARDITAQRRSEQEQDALLSLIAHELRSPLTSIKGFAQLAARALDGPGAKRATRHLRVIDQQTERLGHLIGELADVSRLQRGKLTLIPTPFDLVPLAEATVARQRDTTSHTIGLILPDEPLIVRADPARIEQSLAQLLANAIRFSPASEITVTLERADDSARLTVRDHGIGVPQAERRQIFERFYRATNGGGSGLGLGLFIVDQIVARSGGTIAVDDVAGGGARFCLILPLARVGAGQDA